MEYAQGKIYKIWSPSMPELKCYVGSTKNKLVKRLNSHKGAMRAYELNKVGYCSSFEVLIAPDVRIDLLELHPCGSRQELNAREGDWIRNLDCVNKNLAGRTRAEYEAENRDRIRERERNYYNLNREAIIESSLEYYYANREYVLERSRVRNSHKITCHVCNCEIAVTGVTHHNTSLKHTRNLALRQPESGLENRMTQLAI